MIKAVIIADDLTGALDTGIQFIKKNLSTLVITDLNFEVENISKEIDVIVIDTESRHIDEDVAKQRVKAVVSKFSKISDIKYFYKKIDSTFRGNVGKELEGFIEGLETIYLSFVPGFPENERVVKDGVLYVNNKEITETVFANDILNPMTNSYIPKIVNQQTRIKIISLSERKEKKYTNNEKIIYLYDTLTKNDLYSINEELKNKNEDRYLAGSAGFAEIIAEEIAKEEKSNTIEIKNEKILFICGSVNKTSLEQCKYAQENGYIVKNLKFEEIVMRDFYQTSLEEKEKINDLLKGHDKILIRSSQRNSIIELVKNYSKANFIPIEFITQNVANNIGNLTRFLVEKNNLENIVVFGGDTLIAILREMNISRIYPLAEITSGVVLAKIYFNNNKLNVITKAGGFGNNDIISVIENFLKKHIKK